MAGVIDLLASDVHTNVSYRSGVKIALRRSREKWTHSSVNSRSVSVAFLWEFSPYAMLFLDTEAMVKKKYRNVKISTYLPLHQIQEGFRSLVQQPLSDLSIHFFSRPGNRLAGFLTDHTMWR